MKILVFQQNRSGESKIAGIRKYGGKRFRITTVSIEPDLPPVIDDARIFFPENIEADLVLDYLQHPDLSYDLARICSEKNIPLVASGKKHPSRQVITPPTCCGLSRHNCLGAYGEHFGAPELAVEIADDTIQNITVRRGAPCGATWEAASRIIGCPVSEAPTRLGLQIQFFCSADPSNWDPIHGKSPVHFAGHIHRAALQKAIEKKQVK
jgi:hypothetical protein